MNEDNRKRVYDVLKEQTGYLDSYEDFNKAFDASEGMYLINQPLLMIAGSIADTFYMTEQCYSKATGTERKELFLIPGATHIKTYYVPEYVDQVVAKLAAFFNDNL